jgi:tRNA 2-thiocytidine biosynthesis protein TtcA
VEVILGQHRDDILEPFFMYLFHEVVGHPIIPCDLCGSRDGLPRKWVKQIPDGRAKHAPGRRQVLFRALGNARPSHPLDPAHFDFAGLARKTPES